MSVAAGFFVGLGLGAFVTIPIASVVCWLAWSRAFREFSEHEANIKARNAELDQRIAQGTRQVWPPPLSPEVRDELCREFDQSVKNGEPRKMVLIPKPEPMVRTAPVTEAERQKCLEDLRGAPLSEVVQVWVSGTAVGLGVVLKPAKLVYGTRD